MAKKNRYQMTNRGRKDKPCWCVEDFQGMEGQQVGKCLYTNKSRQIAEGFLRQCREQERKATQDHREQDDTAVKPKSAFRTIDQIGPSQWAGRVGDDIRAVFFYEADAIEWRQNYPLNRGTIDELMERERTREGE